MANKRLDDIGQSDKMLLATEQAERQEQGEDSRVPSHTVTVIITDGPPPSCIWCNQEPACPDYFPYCFSFCAIAAEGDR